MGTSTRRRNAYQSGRWARAAHIQPKLQSKRTQLPTSAVSYCWNWNDEYRDSGDSQDRCALKLIMLEHLQGEIGFIKCHWSRMR
jgi:hypothetical protein